MSYALSSDEYFPMLGTQSDLNASQIRVKRMLLFVNIVFAIKATNDSFSIRQRVVFVPFVAPPVLWHEF